MYVSMCVCMCVYMCVYVHRSPFCIHMYIEVLSVLCFFNTSFFSLCSMHMIVHVLLYQKQCYNIISHYYYIPLPTLLYSVCTQV